MTLQPFDMGQLGRQPCPSASKAVPHRGQRSSFFTMAGNAQS